MHGLLRRCMHMHTPNAIRFLKSQGTNLSQRSNAVVVCVELQVGKELIVDMLDDAHALRQQVLIGLFK